ncbi:MAG: hypothetical protein M1457_10650 [bacterium]|nr:hypothetical protein [bacterium]
MKNEAIAIDASFPGGNIILDRLDGDSVYLRQDPRDTPRWWFYWAFRVRGAAGRSLTFHFTGGNVVGLRGPARSRDGGWTWEWLGMENAALNRFAYRFAADENDVRFSMGMPYQEAQLTAFLKRYDRNPRLRLGRLCTTAQGRNVERLNFGCLDREPQYRVLLTARHHCCEMMANYELEGIMEEVMSDSQAGEWLARHVEFLAIPFMDKDGVENGDQGKSRDPHDHCEDYGRDSIYPSVAALKALAPAWSQGKLVFALDLHCPAIRGEFHDVILCPDRLRGRENWQRTAEYLEILERAGQGPLRFNLEDSRRFNGWDGSGKEGASPNQFSTWVRTVPGVRIGTVIELPYASAGGREVNQDTARAFGRDLARALHEYLDRRGA